MSKLLNPSISMKIIIKLQLRVRKHGLMIPGIITVLMDGQVQLTIPIVSGTMTLGLTLMATSQDMDILPVA